MLTPIFIWLGLSASWKSKQGKEIPLSIPQSILASSHLFLYLWLRKIRCCQRVNDWLSNCPVQGPFIKQCAKIAWASQTILVFRYLFGTKLSGRKKPTLVLSSSYPFPQVSWGLMNSLPSSSLENNFLVISSTVLVVDGHKRNDDQS